MKELTSKRFEEKLKSYKKVEQVKKYVSEKKRYVEVSTPIKKGHRLDVNKVKHKIINELIDDEAKRRETSRAFNKLKSMMTNKIKIVGNTFDGSKKNIVLGWLYYTNKSLVEINTILINENLANIDLTDSQVLEEIAERTGAANFKLEDKGKAFATEVVTKFNTNKE